MIQNTDREVAKFIREGLSLEEISRQQEEETGPYYEEVEDAIEKFSNKTENIEVMSAITLAQIYDFNPKEEIILNPKKHTFLILIFYLLLWKKEVRTKNIPISF